MQIGKEPINLFLFTCDMIVYIENLKNFSKKILELLNEINKVVEFISNNKNQEQFSVLKTNMWKQKLKTQYHLQLLQIKLNP